jgi:hypothetical protein
MGKELALLYASKGAKVVGWDVNMKNNEETISEINHRGLPYGSCLPVTSTETFTICFKQRIVSVVMFPIEKTFLKLPEKCSRRLEMSPF